MLTSAECRMLAQSYKTRANEPGLSTRRRTLLRNIARGFSALANQLEKLAIDVLQDRRGPNARARNVVSSAEQEDA